MFVQQEERGDLFMSLTLLDCDFDCDCDCDFDCD